eukprot:637262_1
MSTAMLYEDTFTVKEVDREGKKFDQVSRIEAHSHSYNSKLTLDVHSNLCKLTREKQFSFVLARTLSLAGSADGGGDHGEEWDFAGEESLMDQYDYVMAGKVFKFHGNPNSESEQFEVIASFGGLLMSLKCPVSQITLHRQGPGQFASR